MSVDLPHLRCLLLRLTEPNIIYILSSFHFPALLKLRMVLIICHEDFSVTSMGKNIAERLPILNRIRSVRITINHDKYHVAVTGRDGLWHESNTNVFNILYRTLTYIGRVEMVLPAIGEQFPFPALEELSVRRLNNARGLRGDQDPLLFIRTLRNFPTITRLTLYYCPPSFLEALFVDSQSPSHLCPLLERLVIFESHNSHRDLIRIIESRLENPRHVTPLRHVTIIGSPSVEGNTISALRELPILVEVKDNDEDDWNLDLPTEGDDLEYD